MRNIKYPKQRLLFFVAQDVESNVRQSLKELMHTLSSGKEWLVQPPFFIDAVDQAGTRDEDFPDETVGGVLDIYSALDGSLSHELDLATLREVEVLVDAVRELSRSHSMEIEFELDGVFVGAIENGHLDKSLEEGFLGEWRRHLGVEK